MEIDSEKYKKLIAHIMAQFKMLETELLAHKAVCFALGQTLISDMEESLEAARNSPAVHQVINKKYDKPLETLLQRIDEQDQGEALLQWFQGWKPEGPAN